MRVSRPDTGGPVLPCGPDVTCASGPTSHQSSEELAKKKGEEKNEQYLT